MSGARSPVDDVRAPGWLRDPAFAGVVLVLVVLLAYATAIVGAGFHFDDFHNLVENPSVRTLANVPRFFVDASLWSAEPGNTMYRPVHMASYALDHALWGYRPAGWLLTNALLHAGVALLVWRLALRLGLTPLASYLAGAVAALHPAHSEVLNYVSSRSESLAALLLLGALHLHLTARAAVGGRRVAAAAGALVVSMLALGAKETPALFFLAVAWMELLLTPGGARPRLIRAAAFGGLYLAGLLAVLAVRGAVLRHALASVPVFESPAGADPQGGGVLSVWDNVVKVQSRVAVLYLQTLVRPVLLNIDHDVARTATWSAAAVAALAIHASVVAFALAEARRGRRLLPLCVGWFWLFLAPSVAFPLNVVMNEHRLYLPGIAVALLAGAALGRVAELLAPRTGARRATAVAASPLLLFALLCMHRSREWRDEVLLWETAARRDPGSARIHMHLGAALQSASSGAPAEAQIALLDRAIAEYELSARMFPGWYDVHLNLGTAFLLRGRISQDPVQLEASLRHFVEAARIVGEGGTRARFWQAQVLTELRRFDEALAIVRSLRAADDSRTTLYDDAEGRILRRMGDRAGAAACLERVIAVEEPEGGVDGMLTLGWWKMEDGDVPGARDLIDRAMTVSKRNRREGREASFRPFLYAARMLRLLGIPGAEGFVADARKLGWSGAEEEVRWVEGGATPGAYRGTRSMPAYGPPR